MRGTFFIITVMTFLLSVTLSLGAADIHEAVKKGDVATVKELIVKHKEVVQTVNKFGRTPLCLACIKQSVELVQVLLPHCNREIINIGDHKGHTPLYWACKKKNLALVKLLLEYCADISPVCFKVTKDSEIKRYLQIVAQYDRSADKVNCILNILFKKPKKAYMYYDLSPKNRVMCYDFSNIFSTRDMFVSQEQEQEQVDEQLCNFLTRLSFARAVTQVLSEEENFDSTDFANLDSRHRDIDIHDIVCEAREKSPLFEEESFVSADFVKLYTMCCDVDMQDIVYEALVKPPVPAINMFNKCGRGVVSLLIWAGCNIQEEFLELAKHIIPYCNDEIVRRYDNNGHNSLIWACYANDMELIEAIVKKCGAEIVDQPNQFGYTPFYFACNLDRTDIVKYFMTICKNETIKKVALNGNTPLFAVRKNNNLELAKCIKPYYQKHLHANDRYNSLICACYVNDIKLVKAIVEKYGANVISQPNKVGCTPFYFACEFNRTNIVKYFASICEEKVMVSAADNGKTPLFAVCKNNNLELFELLLPHCDEKCINKKYEDPRKRNSCPLLLAYFHKNIKMFVQLLKKGADVAVLTRDEQLLMERRLRFRRRGIFVSQKKVQRKQKDIVPAQKQPRTGEKTQREQKEVIPKKKIVVVDNGVDNGKVFLPPLLLEKIQKKPPCYSNPASPVAQVGQHVRMTQFLEPLSISAPSSAQNSPEPSPRERKTLDMPKINVSPPGESFDGEGWDVGERARRAGRASKMKLKSLLLRNTPMRQQARLALGSIKATEIAFCRKKKKKKLKSLKLRPISPFGKLLKRPKGNNKTSGPSWSHLKRAKKYVLKKLEKGKKK